MGDYLASGNKTILCKHCGCTHDISFQTCISKCPMCNGYCITTFSGVVIDKHGNYVC